MEADTMHGHIKRKMNTMIEQSHHLYLPADMQRVFSTATERGYRVEELTTETLPDYHAWAAENVAPLARSFAGIMNKWVLVYQKVSYDY